MEWNIKINSHYDRRNHHQNPGHQHNLIYFYNLFHQLTAKLRTGPHGPSAARPAEVEPGRGREKLFKSQRMEELPVRIGRRKNLARLSHVKVIWNWTSSSFNSNIIKSKTQVPQTPTRTTTTVTILQPHWLLHGSLPQFSSLSFVEYFSV